MTAIHKSLTHRLHASLIARSIGATLLLAAALPSSAVLVSTISGQYVGDTPHIYIHNATGFDFTGVSLTAYAYNGSNALLPAGTTVDQPTGPYTRTQVRSLPNVLGGTDYEFVFSDNGQVCGPNGFTGDFFAGDYDDSYGCNTAAHPGNLLFTFAATWNAQSIYAQFSPDNNATGGFLGFLGLDQAGGAETGFDNGGAASGTGQFGVLANIFVGTAPDPTGQLPEPVSLALVGIGLAGIGLSRRRRAAV